MTAQPEVRSNRDPGGQVKNRSHDENGELAADLVHPGRERVMTKMNNFEAASFLNAPPPISAGYWDGLLPLQQGSCSIRALSI